ncbi:MAG: MarR family winged helix-turn-helix transcriptional regulator [Fervidobacterium sp.]
MFDGYHKGLIYSLNKLQRAIFKIIHEKISKEFGIHPGQIPMLFIINRKPGINQREIADTLNIEPGTVAVMLKRMEKNGFIYREADEKDRRILHVYLTQKAQNVLQHVREIVDNLEKNILSAITDEEIENLGNILNKIEKRLIDEYFQKERDLEC